MVLRESEKHKDRNSVAEIKKQIDRDKERESGKERETERKRD